MPAVFQVAIARDQPTRFGRSLRFHLAFRLVCTAAGVELQDYKPSLGAAGCAVPAPAVPKQDPAFAFTLNFAQSQASAGGVNRGGSVA